MSYYKCSSETIENCAFECCSVEGVCPTCSKDCDSYAVSDYNYRPSNYTSMMVCDRTSNATRVSQLGPFGYLPTAAFINIVLWGSFIVIGVIIYFVRKYCCQNNNSFMCQPPSRAYNPIQSRYQIDQRNRRQPGILAQFPQPASGCDASQQGLYMQHGYQAAYPQSYPAGGYPAGFYRQPGYHKPENPGDYSLPQVYPQQPSIIIK